MSSTDSSSRRPLASRRLPVFQKLAAGLATGGVTPNAISFSSMVFGAAAALAFAGTNHVEGVAGRWCWLAAALGIQLRLLANLLDGMVAVEGKRGGPTGELWNEAPDRVADALILIGAGYALGSEPLLGWAAALAAVFVAYVRALGASVGAGQIFLGPQAKPHRMAVLTVAAVFSAIVPRFHSRLGEEPSPLIALALWVVIAGSLITAVRRLGRIARHLRGKEPR